LPRSIDAAWLDQVWKFEILMLRIRTGFPLTIDRISIIKQMVGYLTRVLRYTIIK